MGGLQLEYVICDLHVFMDHIFKLCQKIMGAPAPRATPPPTHPTFPATL